MFLTFQNTQQILNSFIVYFSFPHVNGVPYNSHAKVYEFVDIVLEENSVKLILYRVNWK